MASQRDPIKDLAIECLAKGLSELELMELIQNNELTAHPIKNRLHNYFRDLSKLWQS